jgi:hypothetical protein
VVVTPAPDQIERREPAVVADDGLAVEHRQEYAGSAVTAATMSGNRAVKSWPLRVESRTPAASRSARMQTRSWWQSLSPLVAV